MQRLKNIFWGDAKSKTHLLSPEEKAYLLDKIGNCSFYEDQFGELSASEEEGLIISIFGKLQSS